MAHRVATILLLVAFSTVTALGFFAMIHAAGEHGGCIAAASRNIVCPTDTDPLAEVAFHVGAFQSFSEAMLAPGLLSALALATSLALIFAFAHKSAGAFALPALAWVRLRRERTAPPPLLLSLREWISRHEMSPNTA